MRLCGCLQLQLPTTDWLVTRHPVSPHSYRWRYCGPRSTLWEATVHPRVVPSVAGVRRGREEVRSGACIMISLSASRKSSEKQSDDSRRHLRTALLVIAYYAGVHLLVESGSVGGERKQLSDMDCSQLRAVEWSWTPLNLFEV